MGKFLTFFIFIAVLGDYVIKGQDKPAFQPFDGEQEFDENEWKLPLDVEKDSLDYPSFLQALNEQESKTEKTGPALNCDDLYSQGVRRSGAQYILVEGIPTQVYCQFNGSGENWLVFQRRFDGEVDFFQPWRNYESGFGDISGEFWLGLEKLHQITFATPHRLRIDLEDFEGEKVHVDYETFSVADQFSRYLVSVHGFSGSKDVGDSFSRQHRFPFSSYDFDNDIWGGNCAHERHGAWWYGRCSLSNLNGRYVKGGKLSMQGILWFTWKRSIRSLKSTTMKIQPINKMLRR